MPLFESPENQWKPVVTSEKQHELITALESGHVIFLPNLSFSLNKDERQLLTPDCLKKGSKNISYNPESKELKGSFESRSELLRGMMSRFAIHSQSLIHSLLSHYQSNLQWGRTSYRPAEVLGRVTSYRKDDTRLHVDAFPATPTQGKRILRVFSNINPVGKPRVWNLGEPFEQVAQRFLPGIKKPFPLSQKGLQLLKITKSYRTLYDHYMLQIHDRMKADGNYQNTVSKQRIDFPANSTWIVMTDDASHAALAGQYLLEQTFSLPVSGMLDVNRSPLKVLENILKQPLA